MIPNEVMYGNYFREVYSGEIVEVIGIDEKTTMLSGNFPDKWQAVSIPIDTDWLEKFGFRLINGRYVLGRYSLKFMEQIGFDGYVVFVDDVKIRGIRYVHELQNLFFWFGVRLKNPLK